MYEHSSQLIISFPHSFSNISGTTLVQKLSRRNREDKRNKKFVSPQFLDVLSQKQRLVVFFKGARELLDVFYVVAEK